MINVSNQEMLEIKNILQKHLTSEKVLAFGSRIKGNNFKFSDLDLAIISNNNVDFSDLKEAFEASDLSFSIDLIDFNACDEYFQKIILEDCRQVDF